MNNNFFKSQKISKEFNLQEVKDVTIKFISENWIIGIDKEKIHWLDFNSKINSIKLMEMMNETLYQNYRYVTMLYDGIENASTSDEDLKLLGNEICYIEEEGIACIYTSVLLYMLIRKSDKRLVKDINFIQGFFHHLLRDDFYSFIPMSKHQQGVHSFLSYKNSLVIDCSAVKQNQAFFEFDIPVIFGNKPIEFELYGYEESKETIFKYASKFSKINFNSIDEWVEYHMKLSEKIKS